MGIVFSGFRMMNKFSNLMLLNLIFTGTFAIFLACANANWVFILLSLSIAGFATYLQMQYVKVLNTYFSAGDEDD